MSSRKILPYGSWPSAIDASLLAKGMMSLGSVSAEGGALYWLEARPAEARTVLVRYALPDGPARDVTPEGFYVRTLVHEYGGLCHAVRGDSVFFSNFEDQRIYRQERDGAPEPITAAPERPRADRFADFDLSADGRWLYAVREHHEDGREAQNEIVRLRTDGSEPPEVIVSGHDFVAFPRVSADGRRLAWIHWDHPNMPWDGTELEVAEISERGLGPVERIAGGLEESIFQPAFSPEGVLHFVSDRSGWWNLYREGGDGCEALAPREAEFGRPLWGLGTSTYSFLPNGRLVCTWTEGGSGHLGVLEGDGLRVVGSTCTTFGWPASVDDSHVALVAASPTQAASVAVLDLRDGGTRVVRTTLESELARADISVPEAITFETEGGRQAHAFYYRPVNSAYAGPPGELPPLVLFSHGGPTGATSSALSNRIQFWTSRGLAVVDVDYGGSTGYGREYRNRLREQWGIVDTADCIAAARHLAAAGEVDPKRMAIRGGSAGGYTTLCALTFHDVFAAGTSYYGVADAEALARDTHKFESRYLDSMIGPYPETVDRYRERSPIHFADRLSCPLLLLQGLEDEVVPPAQAEVMVKALARRGLPHAYVPFEGEQHGFRRAENVLRALLVELYFYGRIFGFDPADEIEPVEIANLD